jgi:hypothetical protein
MLVIWTFALLAALVSGQSIGAVYLGVLEAGGEGTIRNNENVLKPTGCEGCLSVRKWYMDGDAAFG